MRGYKEDLQFQWLLRIPFLTYWHQIILENEFKNYTFDKFWIGYCWERRGKRKAFLSHLNFSLYLYSLIVSISHGQRKNTYISFSAHSHSPPPSHLYLQEHCTFHRGVYVILEMHLLSDLRGVSWNGTQLFLCLSVLRFCIAISADSRRLPRQRENVFEISAYHPSYQQRAHINNSAYGTLPMYNRPTRRRMSVTTFPSRYLPVKSYF